MMTMVTQGKIWMMMTIITQLTMKKLLTMLKAPVCNSAAPRESDFDTTTSSLVGTTINTPVIVNDQVRRVRINPPLL